MIVDTLLSVGKALWGFREKFDSLKGERRAKVVKYLREIANVLDDVTFELKKKQYPHGKCHELYVLAQEFVNVTGDVLKGEAAALQKKLIEAHEVETLMSMMDTDEWPLILIKLEGATGYFSGLATAIENRP